jgi:hypothetical protein
MLAEGMGFELAAQNAPNEAQATVPDCSRSEDRALSPAPVSRKWEHFASQPENLHRPRRRSAKLGDVETDR